MPRFASLPFDILLLVIEQACVDGGLTGRSLALTCKSLHETSHHSRYFSVKITFRKTPQQLVQFLACYTASQAQAAELRGPRPRIRHLFLTAGRLEPASDASPELQRFHDAVRALLALAAADLHSLTLRNDFHRDLPAAARLPLPAALLGATRFPSLRALSLDRGAGHFAPRLSDADAGLSDPDGLGKPSANASLAALPRLARLEIADGAETADLACWARRAPALTHFRLWGLDCGRRDGTRGRAGKLGQRDVARLAPSRGALGGGLFVGLEKLIVEPGPWPARAGDGESRLVRRRRARHQEVIWELESVHREAEMRWALLPARRAAGADEERARAEREWGTEVEGTLDKWEVEERWVERTPETYGSYVWRGPSKSA
ncbi:uncharacterized protein BXZ73DRAFT_99467 [Epithele typhae]|uniref:uncharacterized protein n=1 Tax=Epithele typhae TaxID=378194 RepID=UPI0020072745|nr:uncharacterized protein BXZ73DRAFT_99467 [Epithele typhae]KAH9939264.1 hypothetical protein BXZ73DRAFT_99467 [Epithele typhae]